MFGTVPYDFARKVNPKLENILQHSIHYTFTSSDIYHQTDDITIYKVPYSEHTFWTHYKYGVTGAKPESFSVEILLTDQSGSRAILNHEPQMMTNEWFPLTWSIPSLSTPYDKGLFIRVTHRVEPGTYQCSVCLMGFINLFPTHPSYILTHKNKSIILFQRNIADVQQSDTSYIIAKQKIKEELVFFPYRIKMSKEY